MDEISRKLQELADVMTGRKTPKCKLDGCDNDEFRNQDLCKDHFFKKLEDEVRARQEKIDKAIQEKNDLKKRQDYAKRLRKSKEIKEKAIWQAQQEPVQ